MKHLLTAIAALLVAGSMLGLADWGTVEADSHNIALSDFEDFVAELPYITDAEKTTANAAINETWTGNVVGSHIHSLFQALVLAHGGECHSKWGSLELPQGVQESGSLYASTWQTNGCGRVIVTVTGFAPVNTAWGNLLNNNPRQPGSQEFASNEQSEAYMHEAWQRYLLYSRWGKTDTVLWNAAETFFHAMDGITEAELETVNDYIDKPRTDGSTNLWLKHVHEIFQELVPEHTDCSGYYDPKWAHGSTAIKPGAGGLDDVNCARIIVQITGIQPPTSGWGNPKPDGVSQAVHEQTWKSSSFIQAQNLLEMWERYREYPQRVALEEPGTNIGQVCAFRLNGGQETRGGGDSRPAALLGTATAAEKAAAVRSCGFFLNPDHFHHRTVNGVAQWIYTGPAQPYPQRDRVDHSEPDSDGSVTVRVYKTADDSNPVVIEDNREVADRTQVVNGETVTHIPLMSMGSTTNPCEGKTLEECKLFIENDPALAAANNHDSDHEAGSFMENDPDYQRRRLEAMRILTGCDPNDLSNHCIDWQSGRTPFGQ